MLTALLQIYALVALPFFSPPLPFNLIRTFLSLLLSVARNYFAPRFELIWTKKEDFCSSSILFSDPPRRDIFRDIRIFFRVVWRGKEAIEVEDQVLRASENVRLLFCNENYECFCFKNIGEAIKYKWYETIYNLRPVFSLFLSTQTGKRDETMITVWRTLLSKPEGSVFDQSFHTLIRCLHESQPG